MKFENLYRLVINEAEAIEDVKELASDTQEQQHEDELLTKAMNGDKMTENDMINFLITHSDIVSKGKDGIPLTPTEKIEKAKRIIELGAFESIRDGVIDRIEKQKAEVGALEQLPPELEDPNATPDDIRDIQAGLSDYERMKKLEGEGEEEFGGQDL